MLSRNRIGFVIFATRKSKTKCLMFKTVPIDFSGFHGYKYPKMIPKSEIIVHYTPLLFDIHHPIRNLHSCKTGPTIDHHQQWVLFGTAY